MTPPPEGGDHEESLRFQCLDLDVELTAPRQVLAEFGATCTALLAERPVTQIRAHTSVTARANACLGEVIADLTAAVIADTSYLGVHAGVLHTGAGAVAIPGHSGLGKTTLTAALVQAGLAYMSDEMLAIDRVDQTVRGLARPLALSETSLRALGLAHLHQPEAAETYIAPETFGAVQVGETRLQHVLIATRRRGPVEVDEVSRAEAVNALLSRSFNHFHDPASSFRTVVAVVRECRVWQVQYESAPALADKLLSVLR